MVLEVNQRSWLRTYRSTNPVIRVTRSFAQQVSNEA